MIISNNRNPSLSEFKNLVDAATTRLNDDATKRLAYYLNRNAQLLEDDVKEALDTTAKGTVFEGTIEKISGQRFPDIVAAKYYGVEVKSSKDEKWITLGGSVNESTRVEDVERIFLTFGKLMDPVEFRSRPYEDCLSDVVVTHYPRYKIDMNLSAGDTIFDKMNTTYNDLRLTSDPVGKIVDYYKSQLAYGESLWWTGKSSQHEQLDESTFMKIRLFNTLPTEEKDKIRNIGLSLFPDVLSASNKKYERFALWLAANHRVISTSTRDIFSAGGRRNVYVSVGSEVAAEVPRIIAHICENSTEIAMNIFNTAESVLCETWCVGKIGDDRIEQWIDCVANLCSIQNVSVRTILNRYFKGK